jgi:MerR family mercuric resistance operon transcriptional regulator
MPDHYAISEAARRAGITVHQLRTYLCARLVQPCATTAGGYFLFDDACVARLRLIGAATRAGLRINEISGLVKALETNEPRAVRSARRSVGKAIGSRQAAIVQLQALVAGECGTAAMERAP